MAFEDSYVDAYGIKRKKRISFTDLEMAFDKNPGTNDVEKVYNEDAIKRSLMNLILTRRKERLFQPEVGCRVTDYLFEMVSPLTAINIKNAIEETINNYEPRVDLEDVVVQETEDGHGYRIHILYSIINSTETQELDYFLERIR